MYNNIRLLLIPLALAIQLFACKKNNIEDPKTILPLVVMNLDSIAECLYDNIPRWAYDTDVKKWYRNDRLEYELKVFDTNATISGAYRLFFQCYKESELIESVVLGPIQAPRSQLIDQAVYYENNFKSQPVTKRVYFDSRNQIEATFMGSKDEFYILLKNDPNVTGKVFFKGKTPFIKSLRIEIGANSIWFMNL